MGWVLVSLLHAGIWRVSPLEQECVSLRHQRVFISPAINAATFDDVNDAMHCCIDISEACVQRREPEPKKIRGTEIGDH